MTSLSKTKEIEELTHPLNINRVQSHVAIFVPGFSWSTSAPTEIARMHFHDHRGLTLTNDLVFLRTTLKQLFFRV